MGNGYRTADVAELITAGRDREAAHHGARPAPIREPAPAGTNQGETTMTATLTPSDLGELKAKQQATWRPATTP